MNMAVGQNPVPLVNIKIGGKWMFHPKMGTIGCDNNSHIAGATGFGPLPLVATPPRSQVQPEPKGPRARERVEGAESQRFGGEVSPGPFTCVSLFFFFFLLFFFFFFFFPLIGMRVEQTFFFFGGVAGRSVGWSVGRSVGRLVGWSVGRLLGCLVACLLGSELLGGFGCFCWGLLGFGRG